MGFSEKNNIFWGMKITVDIFRGHHKIGLYLMVISMHLGTFLKVNVQNVFFFFVFVFFFKYFLGVLKIPDIFWGGG